MMVGQPLLARASEAMRAGQASVYVAPDGRQLPLGHVLRRLPRHEAPWEADIAADVSPARTASDVPMAPISETALRLLPALSAPDAFDAATDAAPVAETPPVARRDEPRRRRVVDDAPAEPLASRASSTPAPAEPAASQPPRPDGRRPRSRIVELPGVIVQPTVEESDESDDEVADAATLESQMEVAAEMLAGDQLGDQPLRREEPARDGSALTSSPVTEPPTSASAPRRRGAKRGADTTQTPRASDALFPPTEADRSPQTWLARLQQQGTAAPAKSPAKPPALTQPPAANEPPARGQRPGVRGASRGDQPARAAAIAAQGRQAPLSTRPNKSSDAPGAPEASDTVERPAQAPASSRALLREATGVDPASVRIYRGVEAARVASAQNSDALTDGETIALGAGHATDAPETLGLLAHELAHVAQRRAPRFVPPAALNVSARRQTPTMPAKSALDQPQSRAEARPAVSPADEEAQAALVEARVTSVARAQQAVSFTAPVIAPERPEPPGQTEQAPRRKQVAQPSARPIWGDLPAPWEPLPDWLTEASDAVDSAESPPPFQSAPATPGAPSAPSTPSTPSAAASAPTSGVQRAERGRALPAAEDEAAPAHEGASPEPDLDALAQQVHAILKRRLAAERRRFG
jgi:hypothetical protein